MIKYRSQIENSLILCLNLYGFTLSLLLLLWFFTGEKFFFINVFVSLTPAIFYLLPVVIFLAIILKSRHSFLFLIIPSIVCLFWYGPRFLPFSIETPDGQELILLSYNLNSGNHNYEALDTILRDSRADIVSLQEVNWQTADWLVEQWMTEYPYYVRFSQPDDHSQYSGRFLMSRYPINNHEIVEFPKYTRLYIRAELDIFGQAVNVFNVHMPHPDYPEFDTTDRSRAVNPLLNAAQMYSPAILMGDFNMSDQSQDYQRISGQYQDVYRATTIGFGTSFPNMGRVHNLLGFLPSMIRIDYMFLSEEFAPQEARVLREGASDHFPLWARVILAD